MDISEKNRQIEEAYKELEEKEFRDFMDSDFHEELYDDYYSSDELYDDFDKWGLISELLYYERLGMKPHKEVNGNSSIEELENALEELREASQNSWEQFEEKKAQEMEEQSKYNRSHIPDIDEDDIMNIIMGGYGDMFGY